MGYSMQGGGTPREEGSPEDLNGRVEGGDGRGEG
jgi:hypothetical protein